MGEFMALSAKQKELCRRSNIDPEGMTVILDNDSALRMLHHKSGNTVSIIKGEDQRRREQRGH